jgi:hypothetical protein
MEWYGVFGYMYTFYNNQIRLFGIILTSGENKHEREIKMKTILKDLFKMESCKRAGLMYITSLQAFGMTDNDIVMHNKGYP